MFLPLTTAHASHDREIKRIKNVFLEKEEGKKKKEKKIFVESLAVLLIHSRVIDIFLINREIVMTNYGEGGGGNFSNERLKLTRRNTRPSSY